MAYIKTLYDHIDIPNENIYNHGQNIWDKI